MLTQTAIRVTPSSSRSARTAGREQLEATESNNPLLESMHLMGAVLSYKRNAEIFGEDEPAEYIYTVISGSVRTYKILSDGRRQICGFYLPGDVFGLQFNEEHIFSAEAIADAKILVVKRSALTVLADRDAAVGRELFALTARELRRMHERILLLVKSAQQRVASFLMEMSERAAAGNAIELPMTRQDIADYLGLTIETVSRTLTSLESCAAIEVATSRHIVLRNRSALNRMNG